MEEEEIKDSLDAVATDEVEPAVTTADIEEETTKPIGSPIYARRDSKLRRVLLKQIQPVAYRDNLKSQDFSPMAFLGTVLNLKADRFISLLERFIQRK